MTDILVFTKLENGNYSAPHSGLEMTLDEMVSAIQEYNGNHFATSLLFVSGGDVYMTNHPSIALGG